VALKTDIVKIPSVSISVRILILFTVALVFSSCKSRKNTDYVIIRTEARRLQSAVRETRIDEETNLEELLQEASFDGTIRWELSDDKNFLFRSVNRHSIKAISSEKSYYYIRNNGDVVMIK
jgi:hypothetical protein